MIFWQRVLKSQQAVLRESNKQELLNGQQPRSVGLRRIQKIPTPKKWLVSPFSEVIDQICKKHSLENSYDKKTSNELCNIFQK